MPVNQPDDLVVAFHELHGSNRGSAIETGKADGLHRSTLQETEQTVKASWFARWGK